MKHFAILLCCLFTGFFAANAQSPAPQPAANDAARAATDKLVAKYTLTADQAKQMYTIQVRKQRNQAQFQSFKDSDPALYNAKMQSLQKGTLNSIRRTLRTKEQVALYDKTQREVRNQRAEKRKELSIGNASKATVDAAMLDLYAE